MTRRPVYIGGAVLTVTLLLLAFCVGKQLGAQKSLLSETATSNDILANLHSASYDQTHFYDGIEQEEYQDKLSSYVYGGITSHHLLAREDIARFFAEFRSQSVGTVVLIGPNHYTLGDAAVSVPTRGFTTPFGDIALNTALLAALREAGVVAKDDLPFEYEHAVAALTPYIAYNFKDADIVPIVLQHDVTRAQLDDLVEVLLRQLPDDAIVVASVDFSHHLNRIATEFHDVASVSAIEQFDFDRLFGLEIDSPGSIYILEKFLAGKGAARISYQNKNNTYYTGNRATEDGTSYVFAHFTKGKVTEVETAAISLHAGDMMFAGEIESMLARGADPFEYVKGAEGNFLKGVDVIVGNFEGVLATGKSCRADKEVILQFDHSPLALLQEYGFTGVNLANNHSYDCFEEGLLHTKAQLKAAGLFTLGSERGDGYVVETVGDETIAMIGINEVTRYKDSFAETLEFVRDLARQYDSVVAHVHWGYEYDTEPSGVQRQVAHQLIDAGVQVIIGHHPHVMQTIEVYGEGIIFYSLGNFIFDQTMPETTEGFLVGLVHENGVKRGVLFPYVQSSDFKPKLLPYDQTVSVCDELLADVKRIEECGFQM